MNEPSMKEAVLTGIAILVIVILVVSFISLHGKAGESVKKVATETPVVETVNSTIDGTVEAAKCPTCIFVDATE